MQHNIQSEKEFFTFRSSTQEPFKLFINPVFLEFLMAQSLMR